MNKRRLLGLFSTRALWGRVRRPNRSEGNPRTRRTIWPELRRASAARHAPVCARALRRVRQRPGRRQPWRALLGAVLRRRQLPAGVHPGHVPDQPRQHLLPHADRPQRARLTQGRRAGDGPGLTDRGARHADHAPVGRDVGKRDRLPRGRDGARLARRGHGLSRHGRLHRRRGRRTAASSRRTRSSTRRSS